MFVLLEMIIRHPSTWESVFRIHPEQAGGGLESNTSKDSSKGGVHSNSNSNSSGNGSSSGNGRIGSSGLESGSRGSGGTGSSSAGSGSSSGSGGACSSGGSVSGGARSSSSSGSSGSSSNGHGSSSGNAGAGSSSSGHHGQWSTGSLVAPLHLLALLTHPSRCSPAVHASSMAAALPLLGALVSSVKAVRLSMVLLLGPAARVEPFYLMLKLSKHAFQLLDGKLTLLKGNACQQQHTMGEWEVLVDETEGTDHHGRLQQQQQPHKQGSCKEEVTLEIFKSFLRTGLQLFGTATTAVDTFAVMAGVLSFECIRNEQLAEALVAAARPTLKDSLQQMLQQAKCSAGGGALRQKEEGANTAAAEGATTGAAPGTTGAAAAKQGTAAAAAEEEEDDERGQALTVAGEGAVGTAADRGDGTGVRAEWEAVLDESAAATSAVLAAPALATAATDVMEVSAGSQLYSGLQELCHKRPGGLAVLITLDPIARTQVNPERIQPQLLFSLQHAGFWQRVVADTEEGMEPPGRLIQALLDSAASFEDVFKLVPDELLFAGDAAPLKVLQMLEAKQLVHLSLDRSGREWTQEPHFAVIAARYIHTVKVLFDSLWGIFGKAAWGSFCCGNPGCRVMSGSSEVGLVMGAGAAGRGGGGYCRGCKRVCYCSEACQRECWEGHKEVCSRYQEEKAAVDG